jgi:hypothetical protein
MACYVVLVLAWHILALTFAIVAYWRCVRCVGKHFCGIVVYPLLIFTLLLLSKSIALGVLNVCQGNKRLLTLIFGFLGQLPQRAGISLMYSYNLYVGVRKKVANY